MRMKTLASGLAIAVATLSAPALANLEEMEQLTREMVLEAEQYFNSVPLEEAQETLADPNTDRWIGDRYHVHMFGMDADGNIWADNIFTDLVGLNSLDMADFDGRLYNRDILTETQTSSDVYTLHIRFTNPESGAIVDTVGSCLRPVAEHVICSWANDS